MINCQLELGQGKLPHFVAICWNDIEAITANRFGERWPSRELETGGVKCPSKPFIFASLRCFDVTYCCKILVSKMRPCCTIFICMNLDQFGKDGIETFLGVEQGGGPSRAGFMAASSQYTPRFAISPGCNVFIENNQGGDHNTHNLKLSSLSDALKLCRVQLPWLSLAVRCYGLSNFVIFCHHHHQQPQAHGSLVQRRGLWCLSSSCGSLTSLRWRSSPQHWRLFSIPQSLFSAYEQCHNITSANEVLNNDDPTHLYSNWSGKYDGESPPVPEGSSGEVEQRPHCSHHLGGDAPLRWETVRQDIFVFVIVIVFVFVFIIWDGRQWDKMLIVVATPRQVEEAPSLVSSLPSRVVWVATSVTIHVGTLLVVLLRWDF